jgi:hypothetical protein
MTDSDAGGGPSQPPYPPPSGGYSATPPGYTPPPYAPPQPGQTQQPWDYQPPAGPGAPPGPGGFGAPGTSPLRGIKPDKRTLTIGGAIVGVVIVVIVVIIVATGGSGNSPESTVTGLIQAVTTNNGAAFCTFVPPSELSQCQSSEATLTGGSGHGQVVSQVVQGNEALVAVTGQLCAPYLATSTGSDCASNSDPTAGMPGNGVTFDQAYAAASSSGFTALSPVALEQINGKWYIN